LINVKPITAQEKLYFLRANAFFACAQALLWVRDWERAGNINRSDNFEKCYQYSKRYVIRKKSDDTCVNPKIKHRIHEGICGKLYTAAGEH
jgi:hypothetical protein